MEGRKRKYPTLFDKKKTNIEIFRKFDAEKLKPLHTTIFKREFPLEVYQWYEKLNGESIWSVAKVDGKSVALYGLTPMDFLLHDEIIKGYLCHNVGVIPEFWATGMFQYLGEQTLKAIIVGDQKALGFPNKAAVKGHQRIGWQSIGKMRYWQKKTLNPHTISQHIIKVPYFDESLSDCFHKVDFGIKKDSKWLNWRVSKPFQKYQCFIYRSSGVAVGYLVYKRYETKAHIVDIQANRESVFRELINIAENLAKADDAKLLNLWAFEGSVLERMLTQNGYALDEESYSNSVILYPDAESINKVNLSLADNDVY